MPRGRKFALFFLVVVFLLGNAYSGAILLTLTKGTEVTAHVDDCEVFVWGDCLATWTLPDGTVVHGTLTGSVLTGEDVRASVGPIGAYEGGWAANWPRLVYGAVVDLALISAALIVLFLLSRTRARRRAFEAGIRPDHTVLAVNREGIADKHGSPLWRTHWERKRLTELRSPGGSPAYVVNVDDSPPGATLKLDHANGSTVGLVRTITGDQLTMAICDPAGNQHARLKVTGGFTMTWELTAPDGSSLGTAFLGPRARLARFESRTPEEVRLLTAVFLIEADRMNSAAATVGTIIG